jgi:NAD(P)-dependent dehydrogenase (short-subunit alcohol dehydrogenase family)
MARDLAGRVVIVGVDQPEVARRLAGAGATVVLVGHDADAAGALLAEIEAAAGSGGRAAFFRFANPAAPAAPDSRPPGPGPTPGSGPAPGVEPPWSGPTESELDALVELVAEMWPAR